jgi:hypothetical protein
MSTLSPKISKNERKQSYKSYAKKQFKTRNFSMNFKFCSKLRPKNEKRPKNSLRQRTWLFRSNVRLKSKLTINLPNQLILQVSPLQMGMPLKVNVLRLQLSASRK